MHDIKFTNITNNETAFLNVNHDCLEYKTDYCGLNKKVKNAKLIKFKFDEILKLLMKFYSSLSNTNICYYLKHRIPIMHRQFFRIYSQNPDYVKTLCNELENPLNFEIRNWMIKQGN